MIFCVVISGTIGHVAHGKSTVVKAISGVQVLFICSVVALLLGVMNLNLVYN